MKWNTYGKLVKKFCYAILEQWAGIDKSVQYAGQEFLQIIIMAISQTTERSLGGSGAEVKCLEAVESSTRMQRLTNLQEGDQNPDEAEVNFISRPFKVGCEHGKTQCAILYQVSQASAAALVS